jgi:glycosyltransferase involved in cell wall biosynthesis
MNPMPSSDAEAWHGSALAGSSMGIASMSRGPLVSIVTPSYNQGRYIEETIQSVLNQDYPNLEYLVVDGGSSDNTLDILKKYEGRLTWISERDRGQADAINKGFHMAKGEILAWLNSDDTYLPGAVHKSVRYLEAHPEVGMLYGKGYYIDEDGEFIERYYTEPFDYRRLSEVCFICQPTVFLRAEVVRAVGPLDISLDYCLDYEYWMRIAKRFRIGYLEAYLANYRLHIDTKTLSKRVEFHQETLQMVKRHYGQVPMHWINAYAHVYLIEKLLGEMRGVYGDGWAAPRVKFALPPDWQSEVSLLLQGICSAHAYPLPLQVSTGDQVLHRAVIEGREFALTARVGQNGAVSQRMHAAEVKLSTEKSFIPHLINTQGDTRTLAYRIKKLSLADARGREFTLYGGRTYLLFAIALPVISLVKCIVINRRLSGKELWRTARNLWGDLITFPFRWPSRHR